MKNNSTMVLLDDIANWEKDSQIVVSWSELNVPSNQFSAPLEVEKMASQIKQEYLAWVYNLGQLKIQGESIISHLKLFDNLSFWWMTLIAEKSVYRCPSIYQVYKLRALEKLYIKQNCQGLIYCGHNLNLHKTLEGWCKKIGHPYSRNSSKNCKIISGLSGARNRVSNFPFWMQALSFFIKRWILRLRHRKPFRSPPMPIKEDKNQAMIVTYFPNIDFEKSRKGLFWSRYWGALHDLLDKLPVKINITDSDNFPNILSVVVSGATEPSFIILVFSHRKHDVVEQPKYLWCKEF